MGFGRRGFSVVEVIFTLLLVSVLTLTLLFNNRQFGRNAEGRGVANAAVAELRAARAYAQQHQTHVALAFSTQGSHFFRRFQGEEILKEERNINLVSEGSGVVLWPDLEGAETSPLPSDPDLSHLDGLGYVLFSPDGRASTNGPSFGGNANLLTCVSYSGALTAGRVKLDSVRNGRIIELSRSGGVRLVESRSRHLESLPDSHEDAPIAEPGDGPEVPTVEPEIKSVEFFPKRGTENEIHGIGRSYIEIHPVELEGGKKEFHPLTIRVEAESPSGEPLFLSAEVDGDSGSGFFSNIEEVRMDFDPESSSWVGSLSWKPPFEALQGHEFEFSLRVRDKYDNRVTAVEHAGVSLKAQILPDLRILIQTEDNAIWLTNAQGGEIRRVTPDGIQEERPVWSPNARSFYVREPKGSTRFGIVGYSGDGELREPILDVPGSTRHFAIDSNGFFAAFTCQPHTATLQPEDPAVPPPDEPYEETTWFELRVKHLNSDEPARVVETQASPAFCWGTSRPGELHYERQSLVYPADPTEPPSLERHQDFAEIAGIEARSTKRTSGVYPSVAGGVFSVDNPQVYAKILREEDQPERLFVHTLDGDGHELSRVQVLDGVTLRDLAWSIDGRTLLVARDNTLVALDATDSFRAKTVMSATGKSRFQKAPDREVYYYVEDSKLYSWDEGRPVQLGVKLPAPVVTYAITEPR